MSESGAKENSQNAGKALLIPVSAGELIDRIAILEIKRERIRDPEKLALVGAELAALEAAYIEAGMRSSPAAEQKTKLKKINEQLWDIEDQLRACERTKDFGQKFISLARSVYRLNDERAAAKQQLDALFGSAIRGVKSYQPY